MAERGRVRLDDPIGGYLPDSVDTPAVDGQPITLKHLATHTSGLPRLPTNLNPARRADPYADYTPTQLHAFLDDVQLPDPPGTSYAYSNAGAGLLGHLLARHADTTYAALLERRILQPLGLDDTGVAAPSDTTGPRLATGYTSMTPAAYWTWDALAGAGALRSTAADMLRFLQMNMQPEQRSLAAALSETHVVRHRTAERRAVTLSWHESPAPDGSHIYWQNGGTGGFRSFVGFSPDSGARLVVLVNHAVSLRRFNTFAFQLMKALLPPS